MFCPNCGKDNPDGVPVCAYCGASLTTTPGTPYATPPRVTPATSGLAIASLVLGILSPMTCYLTLPFAVVFGFVALSKINKSGGRLAGQGLAIAGIVCAFASLLLAGIPAAILFPVFARAREAARKASCQNNMKELGLSLSLYMGDYDSCLPSSNLRSGSQTWNPNDFNAFAMEKGAPGRPATMMSVLSPFMKTKSVLWCPSDPRHGPDRVSYYYKAAIDRAWYAGSKKEGDLGFPGDQVAFWEHNGWHWGDADKGAIDGVTINVAFIDGHVASKIIQDSGYTRGENPPDPLPKSGVGEPAWFNWNMVSGASAGTVAAYDTHKFADRLEGTGTPGSSSGRH